MTYVAHLILIVTAMSAPHLVAAGLAAAFPSLRRGFGHIPRTGEVVARFFDENASRDPRDVDATGAR